MHAAPPPPRDDQSVMKIYAIIVCFVDAVLALF